jgi:hypothetical protein
MIDNYDEVIENVNEMITNKMVDVVLYHLVKIR